jgi:hypothetical protein
MEVHVPFSRNRPKSTPADRDRRSLWPAPALSSAWPDCVTDQSLAKIAKNRANKVLKTGITMYDQALANGERRAQGTTPSPVAKAGLAAAGTGELSPISQKVSNDQPFGKKCENQANGLLKAGIA